MALRVRRGLKKDFDPNKLLSGELAILTDAGEMHYCFSAGNVKRLQTAEDLQALLNSSPTAYVALQQLVDDLNNDPNELANILSNISALQTDVGNKASLMTTVKTSIVSAINELVASIALKFNKSDIVQTDTVNDTTKVASAAVVREHGLEIDTLNDNLAGQIYLGKGLFGIAQGADQLTLVGTRLPVPLSINKTMSLDQTTITIADVPYTADTTHDNITISSGMLAAGTRGVPFINLSGFTGLTAGKVYIIQTDNIIKIA